MNSVLELWQFYYDLGKDASSRPNTLRSWAIIGGQDPSLEKPV